MSHQIYISLGTNIDRERHTRNGLDAMTEHFGPLALSKVYESESVGFAGSPFYNLVAGAQTDLSVEAVCRILKSIEADNGRERGEHKFAPRTLDLDLLLFDDLVTNTGVQLPRDEISYNAFVLLPLAEIAPDLVHPVIGDTIADMWRAYDSTKQKLWPIEFSWSENS